MQGRQRYEEMQKKREREREGVCVGVSREVEERRGR